MKYCRNCGSKMDSDAQYCYNCGTPVNDEREERNEESFRRNDTEGSLSESFAEFLKVLINSIKDMGLHITDTIHKKIHMEPDIPKDSQCPYCNSEDTFPIIKSETEIKTKGYSMERGCCGMCLLGPFGLLCGAFGSGAKVKSISLTWWGCKNCGKQHLAQHDAVEMMKTFIDKMAINCLCYGSIASLLLYPILDEFVSEFIRTILIILIAVIVGVSIPLYFIYRLCEDIENQLGYSLWNVLEVEKKKEFWNSIKCSMAALAAALIFVCPILMFFAE